MFNLSTQLIAHTNPSALGASPLGSGFSSPQSRNCSLGQVEQRWSVSSSHFPNYQNWTKKKKSVCWFWQQHWGMGPYKATDTLNSPVVPSSLLFLIFVPSSPSFLVLTYFAFSSCLSATDSNRLFLPWLPTPHFPKAHPQSILQSNFSKT